MAEKECCSIRKDCQEPPCADPHVRWCGSREGKPSRRPDSPSWMMRSLILGMSGNRTRRQLTNTPESVHASIRAWQREACSDEIGTKVIPCRGVVRRLVVHQSPLHLCAVNLTQTIDARIFCGNHARRGKVGDSYGEEKANERYPEDHDSCVL